MDRRTFLAATAVTAGAAGSAGLGAAPGHAAVRSPQDLEPVLTGWFKDTYRSLEAMVADNGLPADNIDLSGGEPVLTENTSVTNIGCWIWSTVAAGGLGVISEREMHARLARTVATIERMKRLHGFWFNWYHTFTGEVLDEWPGSGAPVDHLLSTVDNGWLDVALRIAEDADPLLRGRIRKLRKDIDWSFMYVPYDPADPVAHPGHMSTGFRLADDALTPTSTAPSSPRPASRATSASPTAPFQVTTTGTCCAPSPRTRHRRCHPAATGSCATECGTSTATTPTAAAATRRAGAARCSAL